MIYSNLICGYSRLMQFKDHIEKHRRNYTIAVTAAIIVIVLLIFSIPVQAVIVTVDTDKDTYGRADSIIIFTLSINVENEERVPIQNLTLVISGDTEKSCIFYSSGEAISGCENIVITPSEDTPAEYGYGYLWGNGFQEAGTINQSFGYGYGYGYSDGVPTELEYTIEWDVSAEEAEDGDYTADLIAYVSSDSDFGMYMSESSAEFTIRKNSAPEFSPGLENQTVDQDAELIYDINYTDSDINVEAEYSNESVRDGYDIINGNWHRGQSFSLSSGGTLNTVSCYLARHSGSSSSPITVQIQDDDGSGNPNGTALASTTIAGWSSDIGTYYWKNATFSNPHLLEANITYHLVFSSPVTASYRFGLDASLPDYSDGSIVSSTDGGTTWSSDTSKDHIFKIYSGDKITFSDNASEFDIDPDTGVINWTPTNDDVGTHEVLLTLNDGYINSSDSFTLTVENINDAPVLSAIGNQSARVNELFEFDVDATDVDAGDTLEFSDNTTLFDIDPITGEIAFTPISSQAGLHYINITVADSSAEIDSEVFAINISASDGGGGGGGGGSGTQNINANSANQTQNNTTIALLAVQPIAVKNISSPINNQPIKNNLVNQSPQQESSLAQISGAAVSGLNEIIPLGSSWILILGGAGIFILFGLYQHGLLKFGKSHAKNRSKHKSKAKHKQKRTKHKEMKRAKRKKMKHKTKHNRRIKRHRR